MIVKPVFIFTGLVGLFFGISLLLVPEMILNLVEVIFLIAGPAIAGHTGAWVLAAGVLHCSFEARDIHECGNQYSSSLTSHSY